MFRIEQIIFGGAIYGKERAKNNLLVPTTKELERAMLAAFHSFTSLNHEVAKRNLLYFTPCNSLLFDNNIITAISKIKRNISDFKKLKTLSTINHHSLNIFRF